MAEDKDTATPVLPAINRIKEPTMKHSSTRIRWYKALGYSVKEIHHYLGYRYQHVRNVCTTEPKRAAREDLPPLVIELLELDGDIEAMERHANAEANAAEKSAARVERRATNKARRALKDENAPDNEDVDDEDYGRN